MTSPLCAPDRATANLMNLSAGISSCSSLWFQVEIFFEESKCIESQGWLLFSRRPSRRPAYPDQDGTPSDNGAVHVHSVIMKPSVSLPRRLLLLLASAPICWSPAGRLHRAGLVRLACFGRIPDHCSAAYFKELALTFASQVDLRCGRHLG
jgi:hypothetical protein